jgi:hypothetical protein
VSATPDRRGWTRGEIAFATAATAVLGAWLLWATCGVAISRFFLNPADATESANWGDSFGAFNALVSALGFGGVLVTLALQRRAMSQQQADSLAQSDERHRQEFDRTFFELLKLMREIRSEIFFKYSTAYIEASARTSVDTAHGPEALSRAAREVAFWIREQEKKDGPLTAAALARVYRTKVHVKAETRLGPYYRIIYTILRRISEDTVLTESEKWRYGNIVRSQLQSREVLLLALNGLTSMSNNFKDYLNEFRIMKYLPSGSMKTRLRAAGYAQEAFEARD